MSQKAYSLISGIIFLIVALVHLARIAQGWDLVFAGKPIAMSVSWAGLVITALLAFYGIRFGTRGR